jgi:hypothetical protein
MSFRPGNFEDLAVRLSAIRSSVGQAVPPAIDRQGCLSHNGACLPSPVAPMVPGLVDQRFSLREIVHGEMVVREEEPHAGSGSDAKDFVEIVGRAASRDHLNQIDTWIAPSPIQNPNLLFTPNQQRIHHRQFASESPVGQAVWPACCPNPLQYRASDLRIRHRANIKIPINRIDPSRRHPLPVLARKRQRDPKALWGRLSRPACRAKPHLIRV